MSRKKVASNLETEIITENPWSRFPDGEYGNREINIRGDALPSLNTTTFAYTKSNKVWINLGSYEVIWTDGEKGEPVVGRLFENKEICTRGDIKRAVKAR